MTATPRPRGKAYVYFGCAATSSFTLGAFGQTTTGWELLTSHPAPPEAAGAAGVNRNLSGSMTIGPDYPGCAACRANSFVKCGTCSKLSCWNGDRMSTCGFCGISAETGGTIEEIGVVD